MELTKYLLNPIISYVRAGKPYPNFWGEAHTHVDLMQLHGVRLSCAVYLYHKGTAYYFVDKDDVARVKKKMFQKICAHPEHVADCLSNTRRVIKEGESFFKKVIPTLKTCSDNDLCRIVKKFNNLFLRVQLYGDFTYYMSESVLNDELSRSLETHLGLNSKHANEIMEVLSGFESLSFLEREKLALAQIALSKKTSQVKGHIAAWRHKTFDYWGPVTDDKDFYDRFKKYRKEIEKTKESVGMYRRYDKEQREKKDYIIKKFNLSDGTILLGQLVSQVGFLNDTKKYGVTRLTYLFDYVLDEISSRFEMDKESLYYHLPKEIEEIASGMPPVLKKELKKRMEWNILIFKDGENIECISDRESQISLDIKKIVDKPHVSANDFEEEDIICSGMPASSGDYEGVVVTMFSHNDIHKAKKGMVLVAPKTTVDFIAALHIAGAVVTDYGGLTSHPAIVARELGIPGVVGAGDATKVFQDGDIVRVDGNKGVAKLVRRI